MKFGELLLGFLGLLFEFLDLGPDALVGFGFEFLDLGERPGDRGAARTSGSAKLDVIDER